MRFEIRLKYRDISHRLYTLNYGRHGDNPHLVDSYKEWVRKEFIPLATRLVGRAPHLPDGFTSNLVMVETQAEAQRIAVLLNSYVSSIWDDEEKRYIFMDRGPIPNLFSVDETLDDGTTSL